MAHKIKGKHTQTVVINNSASEWIVTRTAEIDVDEGSALSANGLLRTTVVIAGTLRSENSETLSLSGSRVTIDIKDTGRIFGMFSIEGDRFSVTNDGNIRFSFDQAAAHFESPGGRFENNGKIVSTIAEGFRLANTDVTLVNGKHGQISGATLGVTSATTANYESFLTNFGKIEGGDFSFSGGAGAETVRNKGLLVGDVSLGGGDDRFDARGGKVQGIISGGAGNDTLVTDSGKVRIVEEIGGGDHDAVRSYVSYTLDANVEILRLLGKKDINATGNSGNNILIGNSGDNRIFGSGGYDTMTGGKGDDKFIFKTGGDVQHTITDFQDKHDTIGILGFSTVQKFSDLAGKIFQQGDDVLISVLPAGGRSILLLDTDLADIGKNDFFFG